MRVLLHKTIGSLEQSVVLVITMHIPLITTFQPCVSPRDRAMYFIASVQCRPFMHYGMLGDCQFPCLRFCAWNFITFSLYVHIYIYIYICMHTGRPLLPFLFDLRVRRSTCHVRGSGECLAIRLSFRARSDDARPGSQGNRGDVIRYRWISWEGTARSKARSA